MTSFFRLFYSYFFSENYEETPQPSKQQRVNLLLLPSRAQVIPKVKPVPAALLSQSAGSRCQTQNRQEVNLTVNQNLHCGIDENRLKHEENQQLRENNQQGHEEKQQLHEEKQQLHEEKQKLHEENQQLHEEKQQLHEEKQQLHEENLRHKENQHQCEENQQLHKENQQLHEKNRQLHEKNRRLHEENHRLKQQLQQLHYHSDETELNQHLKEEIQKHKEEHQKLALKLKANQKQIEELQEKTQKLQKENLRFQEDQQAYQKGSAQSHENISDEFQEHYDYMEKEAPNDLGIKGVANKQEFWKKCCHLYQTSYNICYEEIHSVFHEALTSITRLSKEEEECGEVMFSRRKNLINAKAAYQYLLKQCTVQLNELDKTPLVTKVLESFNADDHEWLQEEAETAVEICWKMQTVSPPMFLCQPAKHNESWHETHNKSWHEGPGELIYYRPVVMYTAGGIVACKGFIGKTPDESNVISPCTRTSYGSPDICKEDVCTTQIVKKAIICGGCQMECQDTQETINHNDKYWHEECLPNCSKCKNYVDINESRKSGKHHYHYDCFKCHHCHNTIPTSKDSHSLPDGRILCVVCYYTKLCSCCHNEIRSAAGSHCGSCMHKLTKSICFECNKKVEKHEKIKNNHGIHVYGIFHKTCICDCQGAPAYNHKKICSKCNKKRY